MRSKTKQIAEQSFSDEIQSGNRFEFGSNWKRFLSSLNPARIAQAETSLNEMLEVTSLQGKRFLDIGCGSGLFSLAAKRLGARVVSLDIDRESIYCARQLKERFFPDDPHWEIAEGSILDPESRELGKFDVVYSWGVLHHTGEMWNALERAASFVSPNGQLFIAIYNDQGRASMNWKRVKIIYNRLPKPLNFLILWPALIRLWGPTVVVDFLKGTPFRTWRNYSFDRGMSPWVDVVDWVGGLPFEVAKPEDIFLFYKKRGFSLQNMKTRAGGIGCNEFVFLLPS